MTLDEMLADLYRRLNYAPAPAADVTERLTAFLNETQDEIVSQPNYRRMLFASMTFTTTSGQARYSLPSSVKRIRAIMDLRNQTRLREMPMDQYRTAVPNAVKDTGTPTHYVLESFATVAKQPGQNPQLGAPIYIRSTVNNDLLDWSMTFVETYTYGSTITLTNIGTVPLAPPAQQILGSAVQWIIDFHLNAPAAGNVTLCTSPTPPYNDLVTIASPHLRERFANLYFAMTPSAPLEYLIDYEIDCLPLTVATDEPMLPRRFHRLVVDGARKKEYETRNDMARWQLAERDYQTGLRFLTDYLANDPDDVPTPNGGSVGSVSVLGPYFPPNGYRRGWR